MELEFKPKLSVILAVVHGISVALAYIVTQGNITATILWFAVSNGITAGFIYFRDPRENRNPDLNIQPPIQLGWQFSQM